MSTYLNTNTDRVCMQIKMPRWRDPRADRALVAPPVHIFARSGAASSFPRLPFHYISRAARGHCLGTPGPAKRGERARKKKKL